MMDVKITRPTVLHVVPTYPDEREHEAEQWCWCEPELTFRNEQGAQVWVHRRTQ